jgi:hypothetical protein
METVSYLRQFRVAGYAIFDDARGAVLGIAEHKTGELKP